MTTIRDCRAVSAEPRVRLADLSRARYPLGPAMSGAIRRTRGEVPIAARLHHGRWRMPLVAPYREERCPAIRIHDRLRASCY
jgi:hypothetical protein